MSVIKVQFSVISRIRSIVFAPKSEICPANKVLLVQQVIKVMKEDILKAENLIIQQEFAYSEFDDEFLQSQVNLCALGLKFKLYLN
jgi:hypothetical protein